MSDDILKDIFERSFHGELYHYTDQAGLLGIIGSQEIWASHTQYLNDQKEYLHATSLLKEVIRTAKNKYTSSLEQEILEEMDEGIEGNESMNVCVCSFSEERDSLSQWRAYTNSSAGFSIGFSYSFIKSAVENRKFFLAPCLYDEKQQFMLLDALVDKVVKQNIEMKGSGEYQNFPLGGGLCAYLNRYAPIIKDNSFKDEKEWRIISIPLSCNLENYDFRAGVSMLVPYYRIPLVDSRGDFLPSSVTIGPTPNPTQSKCSVKSFVVRNVLSNVDVYETNVPFRTW